MALRLHVETLEELEHERDRAHFIPNPDTTVGGFVFEPIAVGGFTVEKDVGKLKSSLAASKADLKAAQGKLRLFQDAEGNEIDPEAAKSAMARVAEFEDEPDVKQKVEAAVEARMSQVRDKHQSESAAKDARIASLTKVVEQDMRDRVLLDALMDKSDGRAEPVNARRMLPMFRDQVRMVEDPETGEWEAHVIDSKGNRRITNRTGSEDFMETLELIDEARGMDDMKEFFRGTERKGTGDPPSRRDTPSDPTGTPQTGNPVASLERYHRENTTLDGQ